ncbi:MAG: hypothetical protein ABW034_07910, partial [Steroidobacteraceae bacterium]
RDEAEAREMVQRQTTELGRTGVCDEIVIPALLLTQQHFTAEEITAEDAQFVLEITHEIVRELPVSDAPRRRDARWLGLAASNDIDQSLLDVVAHAIDAPAPPVELISPDLSAEEIEALAAQVCPAIIVMTGVTSQGSVDLRNYCRRLRARLGSTKLIVLQPLLITADLGREAQRLRDAGADVVVSTIAELLAALESIYPEARPPTKQTGEVALKAVGAH